jgi:hypothetical protein
MFFRDPTGAHEQRRRQLKYPQRRIVPQQLCLRFSSVEEERLKSEKR